MLRHAGRSSLLLLDELGRGTSTHDGHAIAFAVLHHIALHSRSRYADVAFPRLHYFLGFAADWTPKPCVDVKQSSRMCLRLCSCPCSVLAGTITTCAAVGRDRGMVPAIGPCLRRTITLWRRTRPCGTRSRSATW